MLAQHSKLTRSAEVEELSTPARIQPQQLCGLWVDSHGKPVEVYSTDAFHVSLYATLTSHGGRSVNLRLREADRGLGWCCGDAVMTEFVSWQVTWTFPDGTFSQWTSSSSVANMAEHHAFQAPEGQPQGMPAMYAACPVFDDSFSGLPAQFVAVPVFVPSACAFASSQPPLHPLPMSCADGQPIVVMWAPQQTGGVQASPVSAGGPIQSLQPKDPQQNLQVSAHVRRSRHLHPEDHQHHTRHLRQPEQPRQPRQPWQLWQQRQQRHPELPQDFQPLEPQQLQSQKELQMQTQPGQLPATSPGEVLGRVWWLSRRAQGCREVQLALEEAPVSVCATIASELKGHVWEAIECSHANHVLQKCITKCDPEGSRFMINEIVAWGPGGATYMAKHRFGCRIFERLIERCPAETLQPLVEELLKEPRALCCHQFASYVMQHLLEFGCADQRCRLVQQILSEVPRMSLHHRASAVVSKALQHAAAESRQEVARELLKGPDQLVHMAHQRFGHAVVAQILRSHGTDEGLRARRLLAGRLASLQASRYGRAVAKGLGASPQSCRSCDSALASHSPPPPGAASGA